MSSRVVRVKICGLTRLADAQAALDAGADLLGFNFYPASPRYISPERAAEIIAALPQTACHVGVFVNAELATVQRITGICHLDYVQLSGDEAPDFARALSPRAFKSIRPRSAEEAEAGAAAYARLDSTDDAAPALLVDAYRAGQYGGTGQQSDWMLAARLASRYRLLLAGGLTPENVADAVRQARPWGVDVASGVESAPGIKDHDKIRRFIQGAKRTGGRMAADMNKAQFLDNLQTERARWEALLAQVDKARLTEQGVAGEWSVKDVIAHVAWFEREMVGVLRQRALRGSDLWNVRQEQRNAVIFQENQYRPLADVLAEAREVYRQLLPLIEALTDEDLNDASRFAEMPAEWKPWQVLADNTYDHYRAHAPSIQTWLEKRR
ncbi:MAG: phosphoribosylanthranilate isomerase [Anaerolineae bacterium]|nr:phosphoribosylanthranilate isomerase [Anaerolineae bacterium]